jgi:hypothetical protein
MTEKNIEMLLDASETVLGIFGLTEPCGRRDGKPKDKKWWMELRRNGMNDMQAEAGSK